MEETREKTAEAPSKKVETTSEPTPKLEDISYMKWQSPGGRVPFLKKTKALAKKIVLAPIAKPVKWLTDLASDEARREKLALTYAARGYTPQAIEETLKQLEPESPEAKYWQNFKAITKTEESPTNLFEHYYEWNRLGKIITKSETLDSNLIARGISFGRFQNFASLRTAFWQSFKKTKIGGFLSKRAAGIVLKVAGPAGAGFMAWETFKKAGKAALAALAMVFMWLAHYGSIAVIGGLGGLLVGIPLGIKTGLMTFGAFAPFIGPFAAIPAVFVGLVTWVGTTIAGGLIGIGVQTLLDKLGATLGQASVPQAGASLIGSIGTTTVGAAKLLAPAAVALTIGGGAIVSHIASSAFVIPAEEEVLVSPHIRVVKTVAFSGNIGDPITYTIQIYAIGKNLTNVRVVDHHEANCQSDPPFLPDQTWNGNVTIPDGAIWKESYSVDTNDTFNNCLIGNTVRVTAQVDGKPEESFSVGSVSIGQPPVVRPWGLPIRDDPQRGSGYTYGQIVPCYHDPTQDCFHEGIDVHSPTSNAPVYSTFPGVSTVARVGETDRAGFFIVLSAGNYQILLSHLAKMPSFNVFDQVGPQAQVGIQGATGNAFGEHVHYQIWENGVVVNPRNFGVPSPPW